MMPENADECMRLVALLHASLDVVSNASLEDLQWLLAVAVKTMLHEQRQRASRQMHQLLMGFLPALMFEASASRHQPWHQMHCKALLFGSVTSFFLCRMPVFDMIETLMARKRVRTTRIFRLIYRSIYVCLTIFIACTIPFFGDLMGVSCFHENHTGLVSLGAHLQNVVPLVAQRYPCMLGPSSYAHHCICQPKACAGFSKLLHLIGAI